jgi:glutathione synthase/RimK-type ligase-like ATP-grasp enzyme
MKNRVILVAGLPNDPSVASVIVALKRRGAVYALWNQRDLLNDCVFLIQSGNPQGVLLVDEEPIELSSIAGVFNRISELELTPEFRSIGSEDPIARHAISANWMLGQWLELTPVPVMNRGTTNESNSTKAFQTQLIRHYLPVPDTLVTNDTKHARAFWEEHRRVVYKSCSGERSIVTELDEETFMASEPNLANCPVLFQQYTEGTDIRAHIVRTEIFATAVMSQSTDYRYDTGASWTAVDLPKEYALKCIALSQALGLELAGIDLRITPSGELYCFEVNPSPAFSVYEDVTGQPIADAIAKHLMGY